MRKLITIVAIVGVVAFVSCFAGVLAIRGSFQDSVDTCDQWYAQTEVNRANLDSLKSQGQLSQGMIDAFNEDMNNYNMKCVYNK